MAFKASDDAFTHPVPTTPEKEGGIGLRSIHYKDLIEQKPATGWLEVHPENYFGGGIHRHYLTKARELYPLSLHAVGLSLGSDQPVDENHLRQIKELIEIYQPFQVSDHASWSASGNAHLNDLLPLPYTEESLSRLCNNIDRTQNYFGRTILLENPSSYVAFADNDMTEYDFLNEAGKRTGCGLLLDVNNIFVQSRNHSFDPYKYIDAVNPEPVGEIHLAGHIERDFEGGTILVDSHNQYVRPEVWDLFEHAIKHLGPTPTLIEWDSDFPALKDLAGEAAKAQTIIDRHAKEWNDAAE